jgi:DNA polymerase-4
LYSILGELLEDVDWIPCMTRKILHVDLDSFFCSVEALLDPKLAGKPFIVGGRPESRGVVASASYPAREFGVHSAMPTAQALRLCPQLLIVDPHRRAYSEFSHKVMALLHDAAPIVEQLSVDEAFLDASDDRRDGRKIADNLKRDIQNRFGLTTSWGVAESKLVAKIATEVGKPDGLIVVPPGEAAAFLAPLPVEMLWGVGPKTQASLTELGIATIGDLATAEHARLRPVFGDRSNELIARASGEDARPVVQEHQAKSMSAERTFARDVSDGPALERTLRTLSEEVGRRLRKDGLAGSTLRLKLRWADFTTITRQTQLEQPTDLDPEIYTGALALFRKAWRQGRPVRLLGVGVSGLAKPARQLSLFDQSWQEDERLLKAVDHIRQKYGRSALRRAVQLDPPHEHDSEGSADG